MKPIILSILLLSQLSFSKEFSCYKTGDISQSVKLYGFIESEKELVDVVISISPDKTRYLGDLYLSDEIKNPDIGNRKKNLYSYFVKSIDNNKVELWFEKNKMANHAESIFFVAIKNQGVTLPLLCEKKNR